jgi:hypothetical protein
MGVPVLSIEVPADRALRVTAVPGDHGWRSMRIEFSDALVADSWVFWQLGADNARFAFDFRPHSHHWQVMRLVRASEHETGVIEVGGAAILMAMTSVGDGYFPVHLDVDAAAMPVALRIDIAGED